MRKIDRVLVVKSQTNAIGVLQRLLEASAEAGEDVSGQFVQAIAKEFQRIQCRLHEVSCQEKVNA